MIFLGILGMVATGICIVVAAVYASRQSCDCEICDGYRKMLDREKRADLMIKGGTIK